MATIQQLLAILPNSRQNAIHAANIASQLGISDGGVEVEARTLIKAAIQNGHIIVSNTRAGYWLSSNKQEIQQYIYSLENRANETMRRAVGVKTAWNNANPNDQIP